MPIPLMICCGVLLGLMFARAAHGMLARTNAAPFATPAFALVGAFGLLDFAPVSGLSVAMSPDWTLAYLVDSQRAPAMAETLCVIVAALTVPLGFMWGAELSARRRLNVLARRIAILSCGSVALCAMLWKRLTVQATYAQFHGDFGIRPIAGTELGYAVLWMLLLLGLASVWTLISLVRLGQRMTND
jgi:hypothetical protein